jgi:DNA-binding NarL/FixJ family response regulator
MKSRVLVADDEPLARRGVRQLLAPHRDMTVVGEARIDRIRELRGDELVVRAQLRS